MITLSMLRVKGEGQSYPHQRTEPTHVALSVLLKCELGFGAEIIEASATKLVTRLIAWGCTDTDTFEGTAEEMLPLLQAAHFYVLASERTSDVMAAAMKELDAVPNGMGRSPGYLNLAWPMVSGSNRLKMAFMLAMKLSEEEIKTGMSMRLDDLETVFALMVEDGLSFAEVIAATSVPESLDDAETGGASALIAAAAQAVASEAVTAS